MATPSNSGVPPARSPPPGFPPITAQDKAKFLKLFLGCHPVNGLLSGTSSLLIMFATGFAVWDRRCLHAVQSTSGLCEGRQGRENLAPFLESGALGDAATHRSALDTDAMLLRESCLSVMFIHILPREDQDTPHFPFTPARAMSWSPEGLRRQSKGGPFTVVAAGT